MPAIQPRDLKYKPLSPSDEFDNERLKQDIETSRLISELDTSSREGLEKYAETVVGDKNALDSASPDSISASQNYIVSEHFKYVIAKAGKMFDSLDDAVVANAFLFNPDTKLHKIKSDKGTETSPLDCSYNAAVDTVAKAHERQQEIKDPKKQRQIIESQLDGLNDYVKGFWINFANDILTGYVETAFDDAKQTMGACGGVKKFAEKQVKVMRTLAEEQGNKKKDLSDKVQEAFEEKKKELGRDLNAGERAGILDGFKEETKAMQEKYGNVEKDLIRYVGILEAAWYQTNYPQKPESNPEEPKENPDNSDSPEKSEED